jgi:hypothetical protein
LITGSTNLPGWSEPKPAGVSSQSPVAEETSRRITV